MASTPESSVRYSVNRLTVETHSTPAEFQSRYEEAVPPLPAEHVAALVQQHAPWPDMVDLVAAAAPHGFLIYFKNDVDPVVRLAGDRASGVAYLMGNHITMERMYRYQPAVVMYAPLHTVIWGDPEGPAYFTVDKPSDQFGSFGDPRITAVGVELDQKLAALLEHLNLRVPGELLTGVS
jgi:hypothetical protein